MAAHSMISSRHAIPGLRGGPSARPGVSPKKKKKRRQAARPNDSKSSEKGSIRKTKAQRAASVTKATAVAAEIAANRGGDVQLDFGDFGDESESDEYSMSSSFSYSNTFSDSISTPGDSYAEDLGPSLCFGCQRRAHHACTDCEAFYCSSCSETVHTNLPGHRVLDLFMDRAPDSERFSVRQDEEDFDDEKVAEAVAALQEPIEEEEEPRPLGERDMQPGLPEAAAAKEHASRLCHTCSKEESPEDALWRCQGCLMVLYCSRACQVKHWKAAHKQECAELKAREIRRIHRAASRRGTPHGTPKNRSRRGTPRSRSRARSGSRRHSRKSTPRSAHKQSPRQSPQRNGPDSIVPQLLDATPVPTPRTAEEHSKSAVALAETLRIIIGAPVSVSRKTATRLLQRSMSMPAHMGRLPLQNPSRRHSSPKQNPGNALPQSSPPEATAEERKTADDPSLGDKEVPAESPVDVGFARSASAPVAVDGDAAGLERKGDGVEERRQRQIYVLERLVQDYNTEAEAEQVPLVEDRQDASAEKKTRARAMTARERLNKQRSRALSLPERERELMEEAVAQRHARIMQQFGGNYRNHEQRSPSKRSMQVKRKIFSSIRQNRSLQAGSGAKSPDRVGLMENSAAYSSPTSKALVRTVWTNRKYGGSMGPDMNFGRRSSEDGLAYKRSRTPPPLQKRDYERRGGSALDAIYRKRLAAEVKEEKTGDAGSVDRTGVALEQPRADAGKAAVPAGEAGEVGEAGEIDEDAASTLLVPMRHRGASRQRLSVSDGMRYQEQMMERLKRQLDELTSGMYSNDNGTASDSDSVAVQDSQEEEEEEEQQDMQSVPDSRESEELASRAQAAPPRASSRAKRPGQTSLRAVASASGSANVRESSPGSGSDSRPKDKRQTSRAGRKRVAPQTTQRKTAKSPPDSKGIRSARRATSSAAARLIRKAAGMSPNADSSRKKPLVAGKRASANDVTDSRRGDEKRKPSVSRRSAARSPQ